MGVDIETIKPGDGVTFPQPGQTVTAHYTGASRSRRRVRREYGCRPDRIPDPSPPPPRRFVLLFPTRARARFHADPRRPRRPSRLAADPSPPLPGTLTDGSKFDSSKDRGRPFEFRIGVGQVIKGWDEGMAKMSVGQVAKLTCTPDYAYGERGMPPVIPPSSTLVFEVELIGVR